MHHTEATPRRRPFRSLAARYALGGQPPSARGPSRHRARTGLHRGGDGPHGEGPRSSPTQRKPVGAALLASLLVATAHAQTPGDIRLTGGDGAHHGRVEIYHDGEWGMVCDDYWDRPNAEVACRQLGYAGATEHLLWFESSNGIRKIWLDDVNCSGSEAELAECPRHGLRDWGSHNCHISEGAGVRCADASTDPAIVLDRTSVTVHEEDDLPTYGHWSAACIGHVSNASRKRDEVSYLVRLGLPSHDKSG